MPMCVLKRGDLCDCMSSRENEARFLHQNDVNLRDRETNGRQSQLFVPHAFCTVRHPNENARLDLRSTAIKQMGQFTHYNLSADFCYCWSRVGENQSDSTVALPQLFINWANFCPLTHFLSQIGPNRPDQ